MHLSLLMIGALPFTAIQSSTPLSSASAEDIKSAAAVLRKGLPVAFPTETDDEAVSRVFTAKGRPSDNPLILHVADGEAGLSKMAAKGEVPDAARRLAKAFWPGPLSICIKANPAAVGRRACAGLDTVVLRVPNHPVALALLRELGPDVPVAAPSANASGRPSPTCAAHVLQDIGDRGIGGVVDGGKCVCSVGIESTIVDVSEPGAVRILRPGGVTREQIEECLGVKVDNTRAHTEEKGGPKAPGMKYRHYAPKAEMRIIKGSSQSVAAEVRLALSCQETGAKNSVGLMAPDSTVAAVKAMLGGDAESVVCVRCGSSEVDLEGWGRDLYGALRHFDDVESVQVIIAQGVGEEGLGEGIMNRMTKAATSKDDIVPSSSA